MNEKKSEPEEASAYLSKTNFKSLVEWMTAEAILRRPADPVEFIRDLLNRKLSSRDESYLPDHPNQYLQACYQEAANRADEHGRIYTEEEQDEVRREEYDFASLDINEVSNKISTAAISVCPAESAEVLFPPSLIEEELAQEAITAKIVARDKRNVCLPLCDREGTVCGVLRLNGATDDDSLLSKLGNTFGIALANALSFRTSTAKANTAQDLLYLICTLLTNADPRQALLHHLPLIFNCQSCQILDSFDNQLPIIAKSCLTNADNNIIRNNDAMCIALPTSHFAALYVNPTSSLPRDNEEPDSSTATPDQTDTQPRTLLLLLKDKEKSAGSIFYDHDQALLELFLACLNRIVIILHGTSSERK